MTPREANIDSILADAANDLRIPTEVAQLILRIGAELARQHDEIVLQRETLLGHERRIADLGREIKRLQGVHGA